MSDKEFPFIKVGLALAIVSSFNQVRAARNSARTPDEAQRTLYQAWAAGDDVVGSVGNAMVFWGIYKRSPGWGIAFGVAGLVGSMFMRAEHVLGPKRTAALPPSHFDSPMATGWYDQQPMAAGWW